MTTRASASRLTAGALRPGMARWRLSAKPRPRHVGSYGGKGTSWRGPRCGGMPVPPGPPSSVQPGVAWPMARWLGVARASPGCVVEALTAVGAVRLQHPCRLLVDRDIARAARRPGATSRANASALGFEPRCPVRLQRLGDQTRRGPSGDGGHAHRASLACAGCRPGDPTPGRGVPVERPGLRQGTPCHWRERREAIPARGLLAPVVLGPLSHRQERGRVGTSAAGLPPADLAVIPTRRGSLDALLELTPLPRTRRPTDGMPWRHRLARRAHHCSTPTHPAGFPTSGRTSADPLAFPVALAAGAIRPPWRLRSTPPPLRVLAVGARHGGPPCRTAV